MDTVIPRWHVRVAAMLRAIGERPGTLLMVLLALNALVFPYAGFVHDARLYGVQVLNRLDSGSFADDLFFRYGSQDQYSLFSPLTAPLAGLLGLPWAFFLLYLVCNSVLIVAMKRLVEALIDDRALSTLVLLFIMVTPLGFGGFRVFHVQEPFLTPRILANACVLFGMERMLKGKLLTALALMIVGGLLHPIMAVGGVAVLTVWSGWKYLPHRVCAAAAGVVILAGLVVVACAPAGAALFGQMDDEWLRHVRIATTYNFPLEWQATDWLHMTLCLGTLAVAAIELRTTKPALARLAVIAVVVGAGGLAATLLASLQGYTLLFQGQPYRALWIARILQPAFAAVVASQLWRTGEERKRLLALAVLAPLGVSTFLAVELAIPLFLLPILIVFCRGVEPAPRRSDWLSRSIAGSLVLGFVGWTAFRLWLNWTFRDLILEHSTRFQFVFVMSGCLGPVVWTLVALTGLLMLWRRLGVGLSLAMLAGTVALAYQSICFAVPNVETLRKQIDRYHGDTQFVAEFLASRQTPGSPRPTVYWSVGAIDLLWLELGVKSYYERLQIQGVMFSRQTAIEGQRRALLVRQFEMQRLGKEKELISERWRELLQELYELPLGEAQPAWADVECLCREPDCDFVIIPQEFPGLYAAGNGRFFIYDCKRLRAHLGARAPADPAVVASTSIVISLPSTSDRKTTP